jgi:hypothetical protein
LLNRLLGAVASLCLLIGAAGCAGGGEDSEDDIRDDLSGGVERWTDEIDAETADCVAEIMIDEVGVEALRDLDLADDEPPSALQEEIAAAVVLAVDDCDLPQLDD